MSNMNNINKKSKKSTKCKKNINNILDSDINKLLNKNHHSYYNTLVLSGGSLKGIAQIGALYCLEKYGMLKNIINIAATSAGSMVGLLYCAGYKPLELFKFMKLLDIKKTRKFDATNVLSSYGLDDGERIILVLKKLVLAKGFSPNMTFKEFYMRTKINFIVTAACINDKKIYYISHLNYPNMEVINFGIRSSIAEPVFFTPNQHEGKIFIDGGCIDNYPIHLFNENINHVIGIYVDDYREYVNDIKYIEQYLMNTIQCLLEGVSHGMIRGYEKQSIKIICKSNGDKPEDIICLFEDGFNATLKKIESGDFDLY